MNNVNELLNSLQRNHVIAALKRLDQGYPTQFSESTKYDVQFNGKRYAPKRVTGLALESMTGETFDPKSFKGGANTLCFKALRRCGFTLVPKDIISGNQTLRSDVDEVLNLQTNYSSANTPEMSRRGELIRRDIPAHFWANIDKIEPIFSNAGFECAIEGSDGVGRKNVSPWIRIFDNEMSSAATEGWYVVFHFSKAGDYFYLTLGCGATFFRGGSFVALPDAELQNKVEWARQTADSANVDVKNYFDPIDLKGNDLSKQFEKAIAFAKAYGIGQLNEETFWHDLRNFCRLLIVIYEKERLGKAPLSAALEDQPAFETEKTSPLRKSSGQGRGLTYPERVAVELRAMDVAKVALVAEGYTNIKDVSVKESFDYSAEKDGTTWIIEVKGTTSLYADSFFLTANELNLHHSKQGTTILALVSDINLDRSEENISASGGKLELITPWDVTKWSFEPTAYRAVRGLG